MKSLYEDSVPNFPWDELVCHFVSQLLAFFHFLFISKVISHTMPFPLNLVVLNALAEVDFLGALMLACMSVSLRRFIFEQVVTISILSHFLREHQYVLFHDTYNHLFSNQEVACLH